MQKPILSTVLRRQYLCDEVMKTIKERIFSIEYNRGDRLIVETLSQELEVSMTPVREGLKALVSEGLVVYDGKSYSVFNPNVKEIADIFRIRRSMERLAASLASESMKVEEIEKLVALFSQEHISRHFSNKSELIRIDKLYHTKILEGADNKRLKTLLEPLQEQCWLIRAWGYSKTFPAWHVERTAEEHLRILAYIKDHQSDEAGIAMENHLINGEERTWESLKGISF
ncbi:MAG: GntR family transcriptional regulator [Spirochaetia bacterium]|nr:GntR family transcriptional regulator [Spirochaetia bacterium]